jgi:hypothetical protein
MKRWFGRRPETPDPSAAAETEAAESAAPAETAATVPPAATVQPAAAAVEPSAADPRRIDIRDLRSLVGDQDELRKGTEVFDRGGLQHLARHGERIFAEAAGSGASPYRVTISLPAGGDAKARCSCMAARSRPICKHAAALLVAWSRAPESFAMSEAPPVVEGGARPARVRTGRVKTEDLIGRGVEQTLALVRELAVTGVAGSPGDRPDQIRALAETLRANRLRRLSARVLELAGLLDASFRRRGSLQPLAWADVVADLLLAARRIERHLAGETLEDRHMEELVGRTWRKADRKPADGLVLVEYAYLVRSTADAFTIRERRLLDVPTGVHYSEKQILPAFMARRTPPLASQAGQRLAGTGGVYPGYAPHRLDMDGVLPTGGLENADLEPIAATAMAGPAAAMAAFAEYRRDVFAPDRLPVAIRADAIVAIGDRLGIVGAEGDAILLAHGEQILDAVEGGGLSVVLGDIDLDGILAVLRPLAVIVSDRGATALRPVAAGTDPRPDRDPALSADWMAPARAAGASPAALSLGEVRDELAAVLVNGLGSLTERAAEPLAARMADLGLERPSALLREVVARPDPADRLDNVVRLHQVLGIGAVRLAGARSIAREGLIPVPGLPAVLIADPGPTLAPDEVAARRAAGSMTAHEAAVHRTRFLAGLPDAAFHEIAPWWLDASAAGQVATTVARLPEPPLELVDRALSFEYGLTAALAAVRILEALPDDRAAEGRLRKTAERRDAVQSAWRIRGFMPERATRVAAVAALWARVDRAAGSSRTRAIADPTVLADLREQLAAGSNRDRRAEAADNLAALEDRAVLPALRHAWQVDAAATVRQAAARAMTSLGDTAMVDPFIDALVARGRQPEDAKAAAYALGVLADGRGVSALLDALGEGWKTTVILEALGDAGRTSVDAIVSRALREPAVAKRRGFVSALETQPAEVVWAALVAALAAANDGAAGAEQGLAILRLAASHPVVRRDIGRRILRLPLGDSRSERQLAKSAAEAVSLEGAKARR